MGSGTSNCYFSCYYSDWNFSLVGLWATVIRNENRCILDRKWPLLTLDLWGNYSENDIELLCSRKCVVRLQMTFHKIMEENLSLYKHKTTIRCAVWKATVLPSIVKGMGSWRHLNENSHYVLCFTKSDHTLHDSAIMVWCWRADKMPTFWSFCIERVKTNIKQAIKENKQSEWFKRLLGW